MSKISNSSIIPLTQGKTALIDSEDFERVNQYKWVYLKSGYAHRTLKANGKWTSQALHRFLLNAPKDLQVDHKDHNLLNCKKENLRLCTQAQNLKNRLKNKNNTSGLKGVYWHYKHKRWAVQIFLNRKKIHLGYFLDRIEAGKAYDLGAIKYFGEFAKLNFAYE